MVYSIEYIKRKYCYHYFIINLKINYMKKISILLTCILLSVSAFAQNIAVKGTVTDASTGETIPFASIQLKGTMTGTATDLNGAYSLNVPSNGVLVFSFVGYENLEVMVDGRNVIDAALAPSTEYLEDVIVVAYGTSTKNAFTGSAAMVKSEDIEKKITTNVTSALAGTTPGVQVISASGDPTSNASTIRIRGVGSMSASNNPLVILDGSPYDGSISSINPNDVESMSVLKDAAASAIYGHRGANGVIIITTKKGKGDATVKFDARFGSNSRLIPNYDVITEPGQYYETFYTMLYNKYFYSGHSSAESYAYANKYLYDNLNGGLGYQVYTVPEGENLVGTNFKLNPNARLGYSDGEYYYTPDNWYDEVFHNSFRQEYNISISGSSEKFNYYASGGYLNDGGIIENSGFKRYTGRMNADYQVKKWFKLSSNMSFTHTDSNTNGSNGSWGSSGNVFYLANNMGPIYPLYVRNADGSIKEDNGRVVFDSNNTNFTRPNFVGNAIRDNRYDSTHYFSDVFNGKASAILTPVKGLTLTATLGLYTSNTRDRELASIFGSGASTDGMAYVEASRGMTINQQYLANYKTDFGGSKSNFEILAGYEQYNLTSQVLYGQNDHLFNPLVGELNNADGTENKITKSYSNYYMTEGFLARAQYDYAGKYFASASYRRDASSRFAKGHQWGNFWSVGGAWLISAEGFMSGATAVDMLKFKASYGQQGNDNLGSYYPYSDQYSHSYNAATGEYSLTLSYKGNENLTWETSKSFNVGLEFGLWNGILNGSVDYFSRKTEDLLYSKDVPLSAGNPTGKTPINVGNIVNNGFEITLDGNIINTKNVNWAWNLNLSHYKNTITKLDDSVSEKGIRGSNYIYEVGGSLYDAFMYKYAGVDVETGRAMYYMHDEDTGEDLVTYVFDEATQYKLGSVMPKLYGGFGTSLNVYGFDLSAQLSFQLGGRFYDGSYQQLMWTQASAGQAWHKDALKAWTPENTMTDVPRLDGDTQVAQSALDRFLISSDYLSLNNVTLGYTFPKNWTKKIALQGLRIYVAGENLAVLTARKGVDPRFNMGLGSMTSGAGIATSAYSAMRTITGGITLTF
jgi:TonB-linked outer membrane protein, SusC/RagA family